MLSAAIYAALVIYSNDSAVMAADVTRVDVAPPALLRADEKTAITTEDGRVLVFAASIDPASYGHVFNEVLQVSTRPDAPAETVTASASTGTPEIALAEVTGSRVNLRAGPSTNDGVLGALTQGTQVELIASLGNGWAQIRAVNSGIEGYMADRFLAEIN